MFGRATVSINESETEVTETVSQAAHLIVEGPDGTGKTTLARALCAAGYAYRHEGPPPAGTSALLHYASALARASQSTVFDRFHVGELVYGPIARGQSGLTPYGMRIMRRIVNGFGVRIVLCLPPFEQAYATWLRRARNGGEFLDRADHYTASYAAFTRLASEAHHVYAYTEGPPPLDDYLAPRPACLPGVIGSPTASVLFVGERSNEPLDLPFIGERGSSVFLNTCLEAAGFEEETMAFTNAYTRARHAVDLSTRVRPGQRVVTLGRQAEVVARSSGITPFATLPRPQFWQRFHTRDAETYVRWLQDIRRTIS